MREYQYGTNAGLRGGDEWWGQGPGGEQTGRGTQQRGVGSTSHAPRESGRGGWVGGHQQCTGTDQPTVQMPQGHGNLLAERSRGGGSQQLAQRFQHSLGYSQHQQGTDGQYPLNGGGGLSGGGGQIGGGGFIGRGSYLPQQGPSQPVYNTTMPGSQMSDWASTGPAPSRGGGNSENIRARDQGQQESSNWTSYENYPGTAEAAYSRERLYSNKRGREQDVTSEQEPASVRPRQ